MKIRLGSEGESVKVIFSPKEVEQIVGVSYRQIQYWDASGFIRPSYRRRGRYRSYTFGDLVLFWVATELRQDGYSVQKLRRVIQGLSKLVSKASDHKLENVTFLIEGERILLFTGTMLMAEESPPGLAQFPVQVLRQKVETLLGDQKIPPDSDLSDVV